MVRGERLLMGPGPVANHEAHVLALLAAVPDGLGPPT